MTFEEYTTLFARIEAALNSRPLCSQPDGTVLTPGHFLTGSHLLLPDDDDEISNINLGARHKLVSQLFRDFWSSWSEYYVNELNNRTKWTKTQLNLKVGDLVLVKGKGAKPGLWPLAIITETFPGIDGLVRKVVVKFNGQFYTRPITQLVLLPVEASDDPSWGTVSSVPTRP